MESDVLASCWFSLFRFGNLLLVTFLLSVFCVLIVFLPLTVGVGCCGFQFLDNAVDFPIFPHFSWWNFDGQSLNRGGGGDGDGDGNFVFS